MELTKENKQHIDNLSYEELLRHWRFAPAGDLWFQGETGSYWQERMKELRDMPGGNDRHIQASKSLG
jgi:hypothetical protein